MGGLVLHHPGCINEKIPDHSQEQGGGEEEPLATPPEQAGSLDQVSHLAQPLGARSDANPRDRRRGDRKLVSPLLSTPTPGR